MSVALEVAVDAPGLQALHYAAAAELPAGTLVRVPLGRQTVTGVVLGTVASPDPATPLRPLAAVFDAIAPLSAPWLALLRFVADYYQRAVGEVVGAALPAPLRTRSPAGIDATEPAAPEEFACTDLGLLALPGALPARATAL